MAFKNCLSSLIKMVRHLRYLHLWSFFLAKLKGPDEKPIKLGGHPRFVNELGKRSFQRFIGMCGDLHIVK